jgi:radical SAM superfamily enzyme YgiQ (UPF0313 family)
MRLALLQVSGGINADWSSPLGLRYLEAACSDVADITVVDGPGAPPGFDVYGIYALSQDWDDALDLGQRLTEAGKSVIYGGPHVTAMDTDVVCIPGEAEIGLRRFLLTGESGRGPYPETLDDLPIPKRGRGKPYLITSRGCPYKCPFCTSSRAAPSVRMHSAARVAKEIAELKPTNPHITIWDDLFAVSRPRLKELADLSPGVTMSCAMRADLCTADRLHELSRLGVNRCGIGAESGSQRVLDQLKPGTSVAGNQAAIERLAALEMRPGAGIIFGHWAETESDVEKTYQWLCENYARGIMYAHSPNILMPLPSTPVWDYAVEHGHVMGEGWRWSRLRYLSMASFPSATDWVNAREENDSVYIGGVPWATLRDMILHYEGRIASGRFGVPGIAGAGTKARIRTARKKLVRAVNAVRRSTR